MSTLTNSNSAQTSPAQALGSPTSVKDGKLVAAEQSGFPWGLFGTLLALALVPLFWKTFRIHLIGDLPGDWGFNVASQQQWIQVLYEVIQEALILPVFFLVGQVIYRVDGVVSYTNELKNRLLGGLLVSLLVYAIYALGMILAAPSLVAASGQKPELVQATVTYFRLEAVGQTFAVGAEFLLLALMTIKSARLLFVYLLLQTLLTVLADAFLVASPEFFAWSLNLGVNGIAWSNILVNLILLVGLGAQFSHDGLLRGAWANLNFSWLKDWWRVGRWSGLDSFVRNAFFFAIIIKMFNGLGEQGTFWLTNSVI